LMPVSMTSTQPREVELPQGPADGVSTLQWSPVANHVIAGSWDNQIRCWEISTTAPPAAKAATAHNAPVLCASWSNDGTKVFSGGCDNKAKCWDLGSNQSIPCGEHSAPVSVIKWCPDINILMTGSWDRTVKFWDGRNPQPVFSLQAPERVYCMDMLGPVCVVGCAERHILYMDMTSPKEFKQKIVSPLKWQTRCISIFPNRTGYAIGSIGGRVGIQYFSDAQKNSNFSFKCHQQPRQKGYASNQKNAQAPKDIYSVNAISFHPKFGTFSTAGSDGCIFFWDKDQKKKMKELPRQSDPITASAFNTDGSFFAYSVGYDWSKGHEAHNPASARNKIMVMAVEESYVRPGAK